MSPVRCWQVDAFTNRLFGGNPAAICWLEDEADPKWMQSVASEMNLSETAFVRRLSDGLELRWLTPTVEVDLCGHATLATAHALWSSVLCRKENHCVFILEAVSWPARRMATLSNSIFRPLHQLPLRSQPICQKHSEPNHRMSEKVASTIKRHRNEKGIIDAS